MGGKRELKFEMEREPEPLLESGGHCALGLPSFAICEAGKAEPETSGRWPLELAMELARPRGPRTGDVWPSAGCGGGGISWWARANRKKKRSLSLLRVLSEKQKLEHGQVASAILELKHRRQVIV